MSLNVGTLHGILELDSKPFDKGVKEAGNKFGGMSKVADKAFGVVKTAAKATSGVIVAALGTALVKGWGRLTAIDDAKAKLSGLGHSAESVQIVMDSALASVKGTAFGLGDAATIAAGAVASGVKPGKDLVRTLKLVADAATIGGTSLGEMGSIFNKVAANGKIQGDVIAQLGDKGIPILQMLGEQIGKTPAEVADLASKGQIGFETFQKAMESGLGGAALKSGNTIKGALANMWAAFGRFGEKLLVGISPIIKDVFGGLTGWLDRIGGMVGPWADKFAEAISGVVSILFKGDYTGPIFGLKEDSWVIDFLFKIRDAVIGLPDTFKHIWVAAKPVLDGLKDKTLAAAKSIFEKLSDAAKVLWPALKDVATVVAGLAAAGWVVALESADKLASLFNNVLAPAISGVVGWAKDHETVVMAVVAAIGAAIAAFKVATAVIKAWEAAQAVFNAVMSANPIMIAVIAIAALVAAAVVAYKKVGWFHDAVDKIAAFLKNTFGPILRNVAKWVTGTLWPALKQAGEWLADKFMSAIRGVADLWTNTLWPAFKAVAGFVTGTLWPAFKSFGGWVEDVMSPIIDGLVQTWNGALKPALTIVAGVLTKVVWPIVKAVAGFIAAVFVVNLKLLAWVWSNLLWPALKAVAGFIGDYVLPVLGKIASVIIDVAAWVGKKIGEIVGFVLGIPGRIGKTISTLWNGLKNGVTTAKDWVGDKISGIVGFVADLPGKIAKAASGMWDGLKSGLTTSINWIIDRLNGLIDGANKLTGWIPGIGDSLKIGHIAHIKMHSGGVVRAASGEGSEVLRLLKVGETVRTARQEADLQKLVASFGAMGASSLSRVGAARARAAAAAGGSSVPSSIRHGDVTVLAETNADPDKIAKEVAWTLKTAGV